MAQIFTVNDDGSIAVSNLALQNTSGNVTHTGFLEVTGNLQVDSNIVVTGTITAGVINAQQLVTPNGSLASFGQWVYNAEDELIGKGFNWTWGGGSVQLLYRTGGKLWTNANIDLAPNAGLSVDGIPVLNQTSLGPTVSQSNLTKVGTLQSLNVSGNVSISDLVLFDTTSNRIGIGTDEPNTTFSIIENGVEFGLNSPAIGLATVGSYSSHDFAIVSDNIARITVKATGEVNIGSAASGNAVLNVYGTINATNIVADNRIERTAPLQFQSTSASSIYGLGLEWNDSVTSRQFIMMAGPDRLWSTESIDLGPNQSYYLNGMVALSAGTLGNTIINSSLQSVGILQNLTVSGDTTLGVVTTNNITLNGETPSIITSTGIAAEGSISLTVQQQKTFYSDSTQINVGDVSLQTKPVKVFGPLSVNINNPDPSLQFSVNGDVSIGGKRFTNGSQAPTEGVFNIGDMCWNTNPTPTGYVGWICITAGTPGQWAPFGLIS
jgi:hypothetical protein